MVPPSPCAATLRSRRPLREHRRRRTLHPLDQERVHPGKPRVLETGEPRARAQPLRRLVQRRPASRVASRQHTGRGVLRPDAGWEEAALRASPALAATLAVRSTASARSWPARCSGRAVCRLPRRSEASPDRFAAPRRVDNSGRRRRLARVVDVCLIGELPRSATPCASIREEEPTPLLLFSSPPTSTDCASFAGLSPATIASALLRRRGIRVHEVPAGWQDRKARARPEQREPRQVRSTAPLRLGRRRPGQRRGHRPGLRLRLRQVPVLAHGGVPDVGMPSPGAGAWLVGSRGCAEVGADSRRGGVAFHDGLRDRHGREVPSRGLPLFGAKLDPGPSRIGSGAFRAVQRMYTAADVGCVRLATTAVAMTTSPEHTFGVQDRQALPGSSP